MFNVILILSLYVFFKTIGYAIYEYSENSNKVVAFIIVFLALISLIAPVVVTIIQ